MIPDGVEGTAREGRCGETSPLERGAKDAEERGLSRGESPFPINAISLIGLSHALLIAIIRELFKRRHGLLVQFELPEG